nr:hypothetical protein [Streptomyces sp. CFMR 7]
MSRWMLVLSSRWARNGLSESTLCATATVSVVFPSSARASEGAGASGFPGTTAPAVSARAAAPEASSVRRRLPGRGCGRRLL